MTTATEKTVVIFRRWKRGSKDLLALFPLEPGNYNPGTCNSYAHIGQHGSADPQHCIRETLPAIQSEYEPLRQELMSLGYNLQVKKRIPRNAYTIRQQKIEAGKRLTLKERAIP